MSIDRVFQIECGLGEISVVDKVVGFKKIRFQTHENVGFGEVNLPVMQMHTAAFWMSFPETFVIDLPWQRPIVVDTLRGIGRAMRLYCVSGLMIAPSDLGFVIGERQHDGGFGTAEGQGYDPTLFFYDSMPGGVGLVPRIYDTRRQLLRAAAEVITGCRCQAGCPACIGPVLGDLPSGESMARRRIALELLVRLGVH